MIVVAHRMPASSGAAAALARAGASMFELDVRLPADGGPPVVTHFGPLWPGSSLFNDGWRVRQGALSSRLGPPLGEAIALLPRACEVLLDLKGPIADPDTAARGLAAEVAEPARIHVCGNAGPIAPGVAALGMRVWRTVGSRAELAAAMGAAGPQPWALTVHHRLLSAAVVATLRQRSPRVVAWTVNSVPRARVLQSLGVDGITTDRPSVMTALRAASG